MRTVVLILLALIALYPIVTAAVWVAGGLLFRLTDEHGEIVPPSGGWPAVTVLIPAYNEEAVVGACVRDALRVDYPSLRVLVLDDGSTDATAAAALAFALNIDLYNDRRAAIAFLLGPLYPIAYWMISGAAALHSETAALVRGPPQRHVSWDIPRERADADR